MVAEYAVLAFMVFYATDGDAAVALDGDAPLEGCAAGEDGDVRSVAAVGADVRGQVAHCF